MTSIAGLTRQRRYESRAQLLLDGVEAADVWEFLRDPASSRVLVPEIVEAAVVSGAGIGERQRYVARVRGRDVVSMAEVTALVPGRLLELTLLNRPYSAARRLELEPMPGGTLLSVSSWVVGGWGTSGLRRVLQEDDDEYVERAARVLPLLLQHQPTQRIATTADGGAPR